MSDTGTIHYPRRGGKPFWCGANTGSAINIIAMVNCEDCMNLLNGKAPSAQPIHHMRRPVLKHHEPYRCGTMAGDGTTAAWEVTCSDCLDLMGGGNSSSPLHTPPLMNENDDGIFLFTDVHHGAGFTMEVVPQTTGNVEITLEDSHNDGHIFTLSHLDRADLLRALLHDFHYSPERGGPNGIDS